MDFEEYVSLSPPPQTRYVGRCFTSWLGRRFFLDD